MARISCKPRKDGKTVALVRYSYSRDRKRNETVTYGSVSLDADPDDVKAYIRVSKTHIRTPFELLFSFEDLRHIKEWLSLHGDPVARALREARDKRTERALLEELSASREAPEDPLMAVTKLLPAAGEMLKALALECKAAGTDPFKELRHRYNEVYKAHKQFELLAKEAGVMKKMSTKQG